MFAVTTPTIEGHPIQQYLGLVTGEAIQGINVIKDIGAGIRNLVGGRAGSYENELREAYRAAVNEMMQRATEMGANAVIGVNVDYFSVGPEGSMLAAVATGTAVRI